MPDVEPRGADRIIPPGKMTINIFFVSGFPSGISFTATRIAATSVWASGRPGLLSFFHKPSSPLKSMQSFQSEDG